MKLTFSQGLYKIDGVEGQEYVGLINDGWTPKITTAGHGYISKTIYVTAKPTVAAKYAQYAEDDKLRARLSARHVERVEKIRPSFAVDSDIVIPVPEGLELRPYQKAGVAFAVARKRTLIADSMRLGKTIQAIGACNYWRAETVLIVCPAVAKVNWQREWNKWTTGPNKATIVKTHGNSVLGLDAPVVIINYDILRKWHTRLLDRLFDVVIYDESHYLKNEDAQRTRCCLGYKREDSRPLRGGCYIATDGTPVYSRIYDLWPICKFMDPNGLGASEWNFKLRYCDMKKVQGVWDYSGASNLEELQERMRASFMIRREKADVAGEIPPNRQTFVIPRLAFLRLLSQERQTFGEANLGVLDQLVEAVRNGSDVSALFSQISRLDMVDRSEIGGDNAALEERPGLSSVRKSLALSKVEPVVEYVRELLQTRDKVVIMAHHREVVEAYEAAFADMGAVKLYGGMTDARRQAAIDRFKNDPTCRVFVGNIISAGQAISLAAADDIVFAELSWVPAEMDQAEERIWDPMKLSACSIHRIVVEDSLDEAMVFVLDRRQRDITKALKVRALLDSVTHVRQGDASGAVG